jgi:Holliday junction resolvase-like predicted endonuclease
VFHFVEVKYRKSDKFGAGFEYVTADKQNRLRQAAIAWLHQYKSSEAQYQIDVLSVAGSIENPVIEYLPNAVQDSSMV